MDGLEGVADACGFCGTQVTECFVVPFWSSASEHKETEELIYTVRTGQSLYTDILNATLSILKKGIWFHMEVKDRDWNERTLY